MTTRQYIGAMIITLLVIWFLSLGGVDDYNTALLVR